MKDDNIKKNEGKCPFRAKFPKCSDECALYVSSIREFDSGQYVGQVHTYMGCCLTMQWQESASQTQRQAMMQNEMAETKQASLFQALATLFDSDKAKQEIYRLIKNNFGELGLLDAPEVDKR